MTIREALQNTQGHDADFFNRSAVNYAEALILSEENILAAVVANIATRREHFPGVAVLTDQRILAVCGLPGMKRTIILQLDKLKRCDEISSLLNYKATFFTEENGFTIIVNLEAGERFSKCLATIHGKEEEFDAVCESGNNHILNPVLIRNMLRKRRAMGKAKAHRKVERDILNDQLAAEQESVLEKPVEDMQAVAYRLNQQLRSAKEHGVVADTDPQAVAARLAAELAMKDANQGL